jgi:hypothetical protein
MHRILACLALVAVPPALSQQELGHHFGVTPSAARAAVGDPITLRFSVHLHERDLITDSLPRPAGELPDGVRILEMHKLTRRTHRALEGTAKVAFYRTGVRELPTFEIPFVRVTANMRGTIRSEPGQIEIASVAPLGNPPLKDLKDLAPVDGVDWLPIGIAAGAAAAGVLMVRQWRRRRRAAGPAALPVPEAPHLPDPYEAALAQLAALDPRDLPAAADVVRGCLADAASVPALERTTSELLRSLPAHLVTEGNRERLTALLADADLVKFAQARTTPAAGPAFLDAARTLLTSWRASARLSRGTADAIG